MRKQLSKLAKVARYTRVFYQIIFKHRQYLQWFYIRSIPNLLIFFVHSLDAFPKPIEMMTKFWLDSQTFIKWSGILSLLNSYPFPPFPFSKHEGKIYLFSIHISSYKGDLFSMILEFTSQSLVTSQIDKDELEIK